MDSSTLSDRQYCLNQDHCSVQERMAFDEICITYGIGTSDYKTNALFHYLSLLLEKNKVINLTAIRTWDAAIILHLLDSLLFIPEFDAIDQGLQDKPFLDMGTGGGMPGIPLAIMRPDRKGVLCDSVKKKIVAVQEFIDTLNLNHQLSTTSQRLEELAREQSGLYGCVVARALASIPVLIEYASPFLDLGGRLIVSKGRPDDQEVYKGQAAASLCGMVLVSDTQYELPNSNGTRRILTYEKTKKSRVPLPRAIGMATKSPLV